MIKIIKPRKFVSFGKIIQLPIQNHLIGPEWASGEKNTAYDCATNITMERSSTSQ
jgi:hypothetical protein